MSEKNYLCNGQCPQVRLELGCLHPKERCCSNCATKRLGLLTSNLNLSQYWNVEKGFWSINGCRLPREFVPKECKQFDCRDNMYFVRLQHAPQGWFVAGRQEVSGRNYEKAKLLWGEFWEKLEELRKVEQGEVNEREQKCDTSTADIRRL